MDIKDITEEVIKNDSLVNELATAQEISVDKFIEQANANEVGNNGYNLDEKFVCTGKLFVRKPAKGQTFAPYIAIETDKQPLSLKSLMGVSSLNGYSVDNNFVATNEYLVGKEKKSRQVKVCVSENFDIDRTQLFQPQSRNFAKFIVLAKDIFTQGTTVTYLGTAVRQLVATKKSPSTSIETYDEGYQRAMTARLWTVE